MKSRVLVMLCVLAVCTSGAFANLVVNGDFEAASPTGWPGGFNTYSMSSQPWYDGPAIVGTGDTYGWAPNGAVGPSTQVIDMTGLAGNSFTFSAWLAGYSSDYGFLRLTFKDGADATVGTAIEFNPWGTDGTDTPMYWQGSANASGVADAAVAHTQRNWSFFEVTDIVPTGALSALLDWEGHVGGAIGSGGSTGNDAYADAITLVPEPATMALLGLGGLFLRRRKN